MNFSFQEESGKPVRVFVKGEPASGKTTFMKKICQEWSMLHTRNEEPVSSEIRETLGQYDLLIPVILCLIKRGASLEKTIKEQINLNEMQTVTLSYMLKKTDKTILILDGLDEYNTKTSQEITGIMQGNTFKHVIITSRAEAVNKTQQWKQITYKEAELKGFSDEHIKLYIDKFFQTSKKLAISLIFHIFKSGSKLLVLARNPGQLCMLCIIHRDKMPIHAMNREQLYKEYVAFLFSRWEQRQILKRQKTPRSEILKKYKEILLKFGTLANINTKLYTLDDDDDDDAIVNDDDSGSDESSDSDDDDSMELSFTMKQINSIVGRDALDFGFLYKSHPSSRFETSRFSFTHKTLHEFFLAYFIYHLNLDSFRHEIYKNRYLLYQEFSLTRFLLHLHLSKKEAYKFTTNIIGSKPDKDLFIHLLDLYEGYQHDECKYQTTLTFNTTEKEICDREKEYSYIYQYPCYVIRADSWYHHQDSLSSYNKDIIRRMNTDKKHKAVTVPLLQTASKQAITCGHPWLMSEYDLYVYCRSDYELTVRGEASELEVLHLLNIEKMGDINLHPVNDTLKVDITRTNLHGCVGLNKPWMALIRSLKMISCKLDASDISAIADSIQASTNSTKAESASPCRLQKLNLNGNSLTGSGADMGRIMPLCTEIGLTECNLEAGDIAAMADSIQACTSLTEDESASPCRLQKLDLSFNSLRGGGADMGRIIPLCTVIHLTECNLEAGDIAAMADSIQACTSLTEDESASPCRLQKLDLSFNSLRGGGADMGRIIPLCTVIHLTECNLEAGDIAAMADSIQACTSPTREESAYPCRLEKLDLSSNSLTGAGADIAKIKPCIPLCAEINLGWCDLNDEDFHAIVNAVIQTHSDRHTSEHDHSTPDTKLTSRIKPASPVAESHTDRRQTSRIKPASPGPSSHIEKLVLDGNKFHDAETVMLLLDNLPPLCNLDLSNNPFSEEMKQEIEKTYRDKHLNLIRTSDLILGYYLKPKETAANETVSFMKSILCGLVSVSLIFVCLIIHFNVLAYNNI